MNEDSTRVSGIMGDLKIKWNAYGGLVYADQN